MGSQPTIYEQILALRSMEIPLWEKKCLTMKEASEYSGIGTSKMQKLIAQHGCEIAISMTGRIFVVRERLERFIDKAKKI